MKKYKLILSLSLSLLAVFLLIVVTGLNEYLSFLMYTPYNYLIILLVFIISIFLYFTIFYFTKGLNNKSLKSVIFGFILFSITLTIIYFTHQRFSLLKTNIDYMENHIEIDFFPVE